MQATGEDCSSPIAVTSGSTYFGTTTGALPNFWFPDTTPAPGNTTLGCQGISSGTTSPDLVYSIEVPANQRLTAVLNTNPDGGTSWDSILNIVAGAGSCGTLGSDGGTQNIVCAAGSDLGNPELAAFNNTSANSQTALVIVKGWSTGSGLFGLTTNVGPVPPGDLCETAFTFDGGLEDGQLLSLATAFHDYSGSANGCASSASGVDMAYRVSVPPGQRANVFVQPDAGLDVSLSLANSIAACNARTCVATSNAGSAGGAERASFSNYGTTPVEVFAVIDGTSSTAAGYFSARATLDTPPLGDACQTAIPLVSGTPLVGESLTNHSNDYTGSGTGCSSTFAGLDRTYSITIPALSRLTVVSTPGASLNTSLSVVEASVGCSARVCLATNDTGGTASADTVVYVNRSAQPLPVFVVVDSSSSSTGTTFDISATVAALLPGDICQGPVVLPTNMSLAMQTVVGYGNDYSSGTGCQLGSGNDRAYSVTIPAGQRVTVTSVAGTGYNPTLSLIAGPAANCDATTRICLNSDNTGSTAGTDVVRYFNGGAADLDVLVLVDSSSTTTGEFTLSAALDTPTAAGELCETAGAPITATSTLTAQSLSGLNNDYVSGGTSCSSAAGIERVHAITIPVGQQAIITATPTDFNLVLNVVAGPAAACGTVPRVCLAGANALSTTTGAESVLVANPGTTPFTVFAMVEASVATVTTGTYDLAVTIAPPPPGETCATAEPIMMNGTITGQTLVGYQSNVGSSTSVGACTYSNTGVERVYEVSVGPGQVLTATATPTGTTSWDVGIYAVAGPASNCSATSSVCLAGSDANGAGAADSITYTNSGTTAQSVFVIVDRYLSGTVGEFSLTINVQ